jgi:hypothetical protein
MCFTFDKNLRFVSKFLFRDQILLKRKVRWNDDDDETSTKKMNYTAHRKSLTKLSENVEWKKANHRKKKENRVQTNLSHHLRFVVESLTFNSLSAHSKSQIERHVENFEFFTTRREEQCLRNDNEFQIQDSNFIKSFLLKHDRDWSHRHVEFNYFNVVLKSSFLITKDEIRQAIKRCKSNNVSKFDDIFNRILKIFVDKLTSHLMNLFRVCVALNYHSRCFREIHIIVLKKSKKKRITRTSRFINRSLF